MRRSQVRLFGAALMLVPLVSTCTPPQGMSAFAHEHMEGASDDRLIRFLIDGSDSPAGQG